MKENIEEGPTLLTVLKNRTWYQASTHTTTLTGRIRQLILTLLRKPPNSLSINSLSKGNLLTAVLTLNHKANSWKLNKKCLALCTVVFLQTKQAGSVLKLTSLLSSNSHLHSKKLSRTSESYSLKKKWSATPLTDQQPRTWVTLINSKLWTCTYIRLNQLRNHLLTGFHILEWPNGK